MLILRRRVGETLKIGPHVSVTVVGIRGNQVHVGIQAPRSLAVRREERAERISASNPDAAIQGRPVARPKITQSATRLRVRLSAPLKEIRT
jgi:carbon storage regulator